MVKLLLLCICGLAFILLNQAKLSAFIGNGDERKAVSTADDLLEKGQAIFERAKGSRIGESAESDLPYYEQNDGFEVALDYFKKAATLEPDNAQAWFKWGQALEYQIIPLSISYSWMSHKFGIFPSPTRPRPFRFSQEISKLKQAVYRQAEEKFAISVKLDPDNIEIHQSICKNLLNQAKLEFDSEKRLNLIKEFEGKYAELAERKTGEGKIIKNWIVDSADLLPFISDEVYWRQSLNHLEQLLNQYIVFLMEQGSSKTVSGELAFSKKSLRERNDVSRALFAAVSGVSSNDWKRMAEIWKLYLKSLSILGLKIDDSQLWAIWDRCLVISLATEKDDDWRGIIRFLETTCELVDKGAFVNSRLAKAMTLVRTAEYEPNQHRKVELAEKALYQLAECKDAAPARPDNSGQQGNRRIRSLNEPEDLELRILKIIGSKEEIETAFTARLKLLADFYESRIQAETDKHNKGLLYMDWARQLLHSAFTEEKPEKMDLLIKEAKVVLKAGKRVKGYSGTGRYGDDLIYDFSDSFQEALALIEMHEKSPEQIRKNLEVAYDDLKEIERDAHRMGFFEQKFFYERFIRVSLKLAEFSSTPVEDKLFLKSKAMEMIIKIVDKERQAPDYILMDKSYDFDYRFVLAQSLIEASTEESPYSSPDGAKMAMIRAMYLYKQYFSDFPTNLKPAWGGYPNLSCFDQATESYQAQLTPLVAQQLKEIRYNLISQGIEDARSKVWLAHIYRHLAVSGMLWPHYRELYFSRAQDLLEQALDMTDSPIDDEQAEGERVYERAWALAELGLLLSEHSMTNEAGAIHQIPPEAEKAWAESDILRPGASHYARARWAAWSKDIDQVKRYLAHGYSNTDCLLFPDYEEAVYDPAFAEIRDQSWFKKAWYGLNVFGGSDVR